MQELDYRQDRQLLERARGGDPAAARQLVERHQERLYRLAYRLAGDVEVARDITQDTFLRAWQHLGRIDDGQALHRWLTRTATNLARDRWRSRRDTVAFDDDVHVHEPRDDAADAAAWAQLGERIQQALMELPHRYREAFVLRHVEEMTHAEICQELGIGLSAAKVRIHRACRMLRELLPEFDEESGP